MPELSRVFLHFPSPDAFHGLYNLVEDVRVEQRLAEKYPGVGRIAEILHGYEVAATRSPVLETHHRNFLRALQGAQTDGRLRATSARPIDEHA
ncbi:MAG: hypothetical protein IPL06_19835 [Betaproteobacteria bacterium]|nr:hypothetical protein [Betaproteobacteria bacterium]